MSESKNPRIQPRHFSPAGGGGSDPRRRGGLVLLVVVILVAAAALFFFFRQEAGDEPAKIEATGAEGTGIGTTGAGDETVPSTEPFDAPPTKSDVSVPQNTPPEPKQAEGTGRSPEELRTQAYLQDEAADLMNQAMRLAEALRDRGAMIWAGEAFAAAQADLDAGDSSMGLTRFQAAVASYSRAVSGFAAIEKGAGQALEKALADGRSALAGGRGTQAAAAFHLAGRISPGHKEAATGLRSAENLDQVLTLINEGDRKEREGDLAGAQSAYRKAADLDPASREARDGVTRVRNRARNDAFSVAMSEGLSWLDDRQWDKARDAFKKASTILPDSPLVQDGLARAERGETEDAIAAHRLRADALELDEQWEGAEKEFASALALDPTLTFAQEGKQRTARRGELAGELAFHIDNPQRLGDEAVLTEATDLLARAHAVTPAGPRHLTQLKELEQLLQRMDRIIQVVLESDNKTEVTVYKVGRLGRFERHELELRPGTYTVIGQRDGYRDVRATLTVQPGITPEPLQVACKDKI